MRKKFFVLLCLMIFATLFFCENAFSAQALLSWDSQEAGGFKIYYGRSKRTCMMPTSTNLCGYEQVVDVGYVFSYPVTVPIGDTYYFSATSYMDGMESTFSLNEVSYTATACSYSISPTSASFTASGGSGSISVATQTGCPWTASSGASWLTISSGSNGTGSGTISYSVAANSGASRIASSTIAGQIFTCNQSGPLYTLAVTKSGTGSGTVANSPTGNSFPSGTAVTLTAANGSNSTFTGWSGACSGTSQTCQLTMNANKSVEATFTLKSYAITALTFKTGTVGKRINEQGVTVWDWFLDYNGNRIWDSGDVTILGFGLATDTPIAGDWNGDGRTKIGTVRKRINEQGVAVWDWFLDYNGNRIWDSGDVTILGFGLATDTPITGDWNGDGRTKIGTVRKTTTTQGVAVLSWFLDYNGNRSWDSGDVTVSAFGASTDTPIAGDWNGDGKTKIGTVRKNSENAYNWYLDYNGNGAWDSGDVTYTSFRTFDETPITGKW